MYDHYIAVDWAQANMAIARMTSKSSQIKVIDVPSDIGELKMYLRHLTGRKILTFEETTSSQWLYTELKMEVDELLVCNPSRNRLLSEGPKTDQIDAKKLCQLLKAGLLKPVFHSGEDFIYLRKLVSGYQDVIQAGVRVKNQRSALFRAVGKSKTEVELGSEVETFVLQGMDGAIERYEQEKERYGQEFERLSKKYKMIRRLRDIPGIGVINATKLVAVVVDPRRFPSKGHFLSYCGLVRLDRVSGGKVYATKKPKYCRVLKSVFKSAALTNTIQNRDNDFSHYYHRLMKEKNLPEHQARHATARRMAVIALGVMKSQKKYHRKGEHVKPTTDL